MNLHLNLLANLIVQQYFSNFRCLLVFSDKFISLDLTEQVPVLQISVYNKNHFKDLIFHYHGCQGIIIANKKPLSTIKTLEKLFRLNLERFNSRRYLILPVEGTKENLTNVFELEELSYVSDLVLVEQHSQIKRRKIVQIRPWEEDAVYSLWTHQYVGVKNNNKRVFLDFWSSQTNKFKFGKDLYPNKLLDQMGRGLRMATFQYEPYSIIGSTEDAYKGSEMSVAITFSKYYNMTPVFVINPEDYWGEIFKNWSGNGLLGNLVADRADIGFCALYTWEAVYHFLDLSKPLARTGITCLVPAPKLAAGWLTPLYSYSPYMWIAVGVLFFICIFSLFYLHYFYSKLQSEQTEVETSVQDLGPLFGYSVFSIIKLFVLQAVTQNEIPKGTSGRYFMGLLFLFSLFLTSTYSSGLASIMTIPRYENPINTIEELVESGLHWGATQDAWTNSIENAEEPLYKTLVARFVATTEENLRDYSKTGHFAFSLERLPHDNFAIGSYIKEDVIGNFHLMQQDFYWEQCVFMARKSSVLLPLLDDFILRVFESGLVGYWQNEAVSLYMDSKVQQAVKFYNYHKDHIVVKLKWSHVQGAFGALCFGYAISTIVLLLEIVLNKMENGKQVAFPSTKVLN